MLKPCFLFRTPMTEPRPFNPVDLKVLVVGDNAFERRLVMDLLIALGVRDIYTADDAVAAFAQLTIKKPHMVIADAEMKPFDGFMLVKEIRSARIPAREVPIVLITAETSSDFAQMARAAGANEVLSKPASAQLLRQCLDDAASRPREIVSARGYQGPERRKAPPADYRGPRRRADDPGVKKAATGVMDRNARAQILAGIDEARARITRWAETGDPTLVDAARAAIERASQAAWSAGADDVLTRALAGALRLTDAARAGHADAHVVQVSLAAARAVLGAPKTRNSMRQALVEALSEVADQREAS
jgi:two-component system chemotaxis response regulator CheY